MSNFLRKLSSRWRPSAARLFVLGLVVLPPLALSHATSASPGTEWSRTEAYSAESADLAAPSPLQTEVTAGPWRLTVQEVVTGDEANNLVTGASPANQAPADGLTYVVAKVLATNAGTVPYRVDGGDFAIVGSSGIARRGPYIIAPDPALDGTVEPGQSLEGWIVGAAASEDQGLILLFDSVTLTGDWADTAVALTDGAALAPVEARTMELNRTGRDAGDPAGFDTPVATRDWVIELIAVKQGADTLGLFPQSDYRTTALESGKAGSSATWIGFQVRITNNRTGGQPAFLPPTAFTLADIEGNPNPDLSWLSAPNPDASGSYFPGASREGWILFDTVSPLDSPDVSLLRFQPYRSDDDPRYFTWGGGGTSTPSEPPFEGTLETGTAVSTTEDLVRMRDAPSTDGEIVDEMPIGTGLTVTGPPEEGDGITWYPVENAESGDKGYVAQQFIEPTD